MSRSPHGKAATDFRTSYIDNSIIKPWSIVVWAKSH